MKKKQKTKRKLKPLNLAIIAGAILGMTVWFSPTKKVVETVVPEITDVKGLTTADSDLDESDPDELDNYLIELEQDFSTF